ncbi:hypothetical protein QVD17_09521 [Tagetes erecta]|uniref:Uncharacterized protein n=1 Tax=Tagetes erecta TaxID=13708 RepID=A0AAD8L406_TARER|nr:hypothetical protein QVD17_09521 [Tagetes erecta]
MALLLYRLVFPQNFFNVCKTKLSIQPIVQVKRRQHRLICSGAKTADSPSATSKPTMWPRGFVKLLDDNFPTNLKEKMRELEKKVEALNIDFENGSLSELEVLEHVDDIEKLGLGYRFQNHIKRALDTITSRHNQINGGLHEASLRFRILRQHGYNVSQDFLKRFKDSHGGFIGSIQTDVKGLLSLYEASHLAFTEESDLHEAKLFATEHLMKLKGQEIDAQLVEQINQALEIPLYHRMLRLQARFSIDAYKKQQDANPLLLELATLDFNMVQSTLKSELKELLKWWNFVGPSHKLDKVRDPLVECFFWTVGVVFEPQYHTCRVWLAKVCTLITVLDDIFDVYGTVDELEYFKDAVNRWDVNAMEQMPVHLQLGFAALHDTMTNMSSNTSIGQREDILPILVKVWGELFEAFIVEAKWSHEKHIPTLDEYLDNGWRSISGEVILTHGYFLTNQQINKHDIQALDKYHHLMKCSSMLVRLYNDIAISSSEIESDNSINAISCYMHEKGVCENEAREYMATLIDEAWRKLIKEYVACSQELPNPFIDMAINLARISCCAYQFGDGHGTHDARAIDRVLSILIKPIAIRD